MQKNLFWCAVAVLFTVAAGCVAPMRIGDREYEVMAIKNGKTNLPPHMSWIGRGTITSGVIPARIEGKPSNSGFLEIEKFFDLPRSFASAGSFRGGPAVSVEEVRGNSDVYDYNVRTVSPGISILSERFGMLTGSQTKLRLLYGFRHDWGNSRVSSYEGDERSGLLRWSWSSVLYRNEGFFPYLNKTEVYARGDIDRSDRKNSSIEVDTDPSAKIKMVRVPVNPVYDPPNENTYLTAGVVVNAVRFGKGTRDVTIRAGAEWTDEREFQAKSVRPMLGLTFFGEHFTVMLWKKFVYEDGGKQDAPDSAGVSAWLTVWSW